MSENELIKEIEEDIRRERMDKLWNRFGKIMVGVSIGVVLATTAIVLMQNHKREQEMQQTAKLIEGVDRLTLEDYKGAISAFSALTDDDTSPYYGVAMLRKAQAQAASGDEEGAARSYQALVKHDAAFGELAAMMVPAEAQKTFVPGTIFPYTGREWQAWQAMQQGKKDEAVTQFLALRNDAKVPLSMRNRLQDVLQYIAPDKLANDKTMKEKPI